MDASDTVPRTAYANLINSLRQTGSDFAAGSVRTVGLGRRRRPPWTQESHGLDRPALTLADFPIAMLDFSATNRVFREGLLGRRCWRLSRTLQQARASRSPAPHCRPGNSTFSKQ